MSCKVGNQTNSQDPQAVNSRVFVGNLNTFQCSKTDVERIFQRYGRIAGISMHKGYAFIQFTNPFDARSACLGEDGRLLWGQTLDVNMVAEPKAHQTGRKRQNVAKTGNDWDYYYDSYYAQIGFPGPRLVPPMKRARLHVPPNSQNKSVLKLPAPNKSYPACNSLSDIKSYSTPDILICGNCRELFSEVGQLIEHKKTYCKLRFTCKCHQLNGKTPGEEPAALLCSQCKDSFHSAWDLMVHVQAAHMLNIYQLGVETREQSQETKDGERGENGGCPSNGSGSPNGFNPNGTLIGDSVMEGSHCQTDGNSSCKSESSASLCSIMSMDTPGYHHLGPTTATSTSTNESSLALFADNGNDMSSCRSCSGRVVSSSNGEICNGVNQAGYMNGNISLVNGCFPTPSSMPGQGNSSLSLIPFSQPMEASTQTSLSDNPLISSNGPSVNVCGTSSGSTIDEHCSMASTIKSEAHVQHLSLANGHVAAGV